ncbi:MAG: TIGR04086 family membrane protein [Lachnoclostridium sp.]|nr:TIGR04086 family membrane protein [Lachnoclostridium sp.]
MSASKPWRIICTLFISYFLSAVLLLIMTFLLYKFRLDESQITVGIYGTYILSCLLGGFLAGKAMKTRRFFWGLLTGILYFAFLFLMSTLQEQSVTAELSQILIILGICAGSGMAGGIIS